MNAIARRVRLTEIRRPGSPFEKRAMFQTWAQISLIVIILIWTGSFVFGFNTALGLLTLIGFFNAVIGLRIPSIGVLGVGMLAALDEVNRRYLFQGGGGLLRWNTFNYWLLLVVLISIIYMLRLRDPHTRILQIFLLLIGLQLVISPDLSSGLQVLISVVSIFGLMIYFYRSKLKPNTLLWLGILNGTLGALGGLVFNLQFNNLPYLDPNIWSFFPATAMLSICMGYRVSETRSLDRIILIALAVINGVWIFLSGSRGNMLIGLCCLGFMFMATRSFSWKTFWLTVVLIGGVWLSLQFSDQLDFAMERLDDTFNPRYSLTRRTSRRSVIAQAGWEMFRDNPFGVGTGGFLAVSGQTDALDFGRPAHSAWVKTLAENGILGIVILGAYVVSFAWVGWRRRGEDLFLYGLFVSITLVVTFSSKEFEGVGMWFLAAWGTAILNQKEDRDGLRNRPFRSRLWNYRFHLE